MRLTFLLARHFWANGETATWRVADGFDPAVIDWLKQHYTRLELERPAELRILGRPVVMEYAPSTDVFGRGVTAITAASPRWRVPARLWEGLRLGPRLARARARAGADTLTVAVPLAGAMTALTVRLAGRAIWWLLRGGWRAVRAGVTRARAPEKH